MKTIYKCKFCNKTSNNLEIIWDCEAIHLGLSKQEIMQYKELTKGVVNKYDLFVDEKETIDSLSDENKIILNTLRNNLVIAIKELIYFENKHNLKSTVDQGIRKTYGIDD